MPTVEDYLREKGIKLITPIKKCRPGLIPIGFKDNGKETLYTCRRSLDEVPIVEGIIGKLTRVRCLGRECANFLTAKSNSTAPHEALIYRGRKSER